MVEDLEEKIMGLEAELNEVLQVLAKSCPEKLDWIKANYPNFEVKLDEELKK